MDTFRTFLEAVDNSKKIVSFDFDNTLQVLNTKEPIFSVIEKLIDYDKKGYKIVIVTARHKNERPEINHFIDIYELPVKDVYFTNQRLKGPILKKIGADIHIDDDPKQLTSAREHGIKAINALRIIALDNPNYNHLHKHL